MWIFSAPSRVSLQTLNFNRRSPQGERRSPHIKRFVRLGFQSTLPVRGATLLPLPVVRYLEFQSTLPSRRATNVIWCRKGAHEFQSTLPSRGATVDLLGLGGGALISIHAPLAGSDSALPFRAYALIIFQSTLPSRGATVRRSKSISMMSCISIHAPLAGSDAWEARTLLCPVYFNPRSPRGERPAPPPH